MCFIMTEWEDIVTFKPSQYKALMRQPLIFDGRNCYEPNVMSEAGIKYFSIGRTETNLNL